WREPESVIGVLGVVLDAAGAEVQLNPNEVAGLGELRASHVVDRQQPVARLGGKAGRRHADDETQNRGDRQCSRSKFPRTAHLLVSLCTPVGSEPVRGVYCCPRIRVKHFLRIFLHFPRSQSSQRRTPPLTSASCAPLSSFRARAA